LSLQVKLLRAIEGGGYTPVGGDKLVKADFRVVAATHRDLRERVEQQKMRQDFYYRIHLIPISLPPLRQRKEDMPQLVQHFLSSLGQGNILHNLPESVMRAFRHYDWPGNVRELQNVIQRYVTLREIDLPLATDVEAQPEIASSLLPFKDNLFVPLTEALDDAEKTYIVQCLHAHQWKRGRVAQILGIDRRTLFRKMKSHGLL
jgi:DNA-binding NtrC family response regulator